MSPSGPAEPFRWKDGERLIVFGRGCIDDAVEIAGGPFTLLGTERSLGLVPALATAADAVHQVSAGRVDELAAALRPSVQGERLVALGGGRVVDVAKALAAAAGAGTVSVVAIPTTLSGAEMTAIHRHAVGVAPDAPRVRPAVVINDPALSASQPPSQLAASAANALGHLAEGPLTPLRSPVIRQAALEGAGLLATGFGPGAEVDRPEVRDALALAALLAGYVIGSAWYGLHHVLAQTVARLTPVGHGGANAILLPHSLRALRRRFPERLADLDQALGEDAARLAERLAAATGVTRLRDGGVTEAELERCIEQAATRPELQMTPPAADRDELRALFQAAY